MSIQKEDARDYLIRYNPRTGLAHVTDLCPCQSHNLVFPLAQLVSLSRKHLSYISHVRLSLGIGWVFLPQICYLTNDKAH